jgi:hypothetical protein
MSRRSHAKTELFFRFPRTRAVIRRETRTPRRPIETRSHSATISNMIRVILHGRLGNNLFQYAFGRVLAERHGVPLVLDASIYNHVTWPYVAPLKRLPGFTSGRSKLARPWSFGSRALKKITRKHHWEFIGKPVIRERENDHSFDPCLLEAPADCVVDGYFQTPLYFRGIEPLLRREFSTAELGLEEGLEEIAAGLRSPASVAVHVRRTDYVNNRNLHLAGIDYYQQAMDQLRGEVPGARFFIFSDDPAWCRQNLVSSDIRVLTHSDPFQPLTDLHLMSLASHHIIANSSYSWWAAWLGAKPGQLVIMPDLWFKDTIHAPVEEKRL